MGRASFSVGSRVWLFALSGMLCLLWVSQVFPQERKWLPLAADGVHDPRSPALKQLQEPREALSRLAPDPHVGNQVRWVKALELGQINPRTNIFPETKVSVLDQDIIMSNTGSRPKVRFPHKQHSLWLDCAICHEQLFKSKAGGNNISMLSILEGQQCGLCHGAVAFPLTECDRCHSVPHGVPIPDAIIGK
ncbi:MAG: hypothetical protein HYU77_15335 [Betaproteobacteria bacterium]|nr:hypothetical protein [Betaproteobacteria bacterium]